LGHEREHFRFPWGEAGERVGFAAAGQELADDLRVERRATVRDPLECPDELPDVGYPVFEQVPDFVLPAVPAPLPAPQLLNTLRPRHTGRPGQPPERRREKGTLPSEIESRSLGCPGHDGLVQEEPLLVGNRGMPAFDPGRTGSYLIRVTPWTWRSLPCGLLGCDG
jgi:hypothetical protein